jgi:plasmid stabilization system protein ParE
LARVEFTHLFSDDAHRQVDLLGREGEWARVIALIGELALLRERLATSPELGRELLSDERETLRRIALSRVPYFIWYRYDPVARVVRFVRLFHAHQLTPRPKLP